MIKKLHLGYMIAYIIILAALLNFVLGLIVWMRNYKNPLNAYFGAFSILIALWVVLNFMFQLNPTLILIKIIYGLGLFLPLTAYLWIFYIGDNQRRSTLSTFVLAGLLFFSTILSFLTLFTSTIVEYPINNIDVKVGPLYNLYSLYLLLLFFGLCLQFFFVYKRSNKDTRVKLRYVLLGFFCFIAIVSLVSIILPSLGITSFSVFDSPSSIIFVGFTFYAIVKHNLMKIKVILTEVMVFVIGAILFAEIFTVKELSYIAIRIIILLAYIYFARLLVASVYTEIKKSEEIQDLATKLQKANAHLKELDSVKNEFISVATHEVRTPIATIEGYLSMVSNEKVGKLNKRQKEMIDKAYQSNQSLADLVKDLLDVSRIEQQRIKINPARTHIDKLLSDLVENFKIIAEKKNIKVKFNQIGESLPPVNVDPDKIKEVAVNIIGNAIKFTNSGSVTVSCGQEESEILVQIADTGRGIDPKEMPHLFEKFYQSDLTATREEEGTGLGLYIAKSIIELHGGRIWAESKLGRGSKFYFTIPVAE